MDSVLQSREADPEEVLFNLGFAESEAFAKIPLRFLKQPSKVFILGSMEFTTQNGKNLSIFPDE